MRANREIVITSLPDRKKVFAELYSDVGQWAEITQEDGSLLLTIFPNRFSSGAEGSWTFSLDEVLEALQVAKEKLVEGRP